MGDKRAVPCAFVLLMDKTTASYRLMMKKILEIVDFQPNLPVRVVMDYEKAVWNVVEELLPEAKRTGCYFHMLQALRRHLQESGLIGLYNNCPKFNYLCKLIQVKLIIKRYWPTI